MMNRLSRWVPLAGVLFTVLLAIVMFATPTTPDVNDSVAKVTSFYASHRGGLQVQAYLLVYLAVVGVVFFGVLTSYLRRMGADVLARVAFAGSVIMAVGFASGAACTEILTHKSVTLNAGSAQTLNLINNDMPVFALVAGVLLAMIATGIAVLTTKALPAWMGWVAILSGVGSGIGSVISWIGMMLAALWILVASVMLYQRMNATSAAAQPAGGSGRIPAQGEAQASESGMSIGG